MSLIYEVSSSVIKNTYKIFASLLFNNNLDYGNKIMMRDGEPVLTNGAEQTINQYAERALANTFFRNGADRRFEPGAARIAITECGWNPFKDESDVDVLKISRLKKALEFITTNFNDRNKVDNYLNNKSLAEIYAAYGEAIAKNKDLENKKLATQDFNNEHKYKIIRIDSFTDAKNYYEYTNPKSRWCLTYSLTNYRDYTENNTYAMYFCLRDDIDSVAYEVGENCPLDEYGKSMLCVIVDTEGDLATFTTRWNHKDANGKAVPADNGVGDKLTVSNIVGVNFNKVFKPYTPEELEEIKSRRLINSYEELVANNYPSTDFDTYMTAIYEYFETKNSEMEEDGASEDDLYSIDTYNDLFGLIDEYESEVDDSSDNYTFDITKCMPYKDRAIIASNNGYYKLVTFKTELTDWCDAIIMLNHGHFACIKEHNKDFYIIKDKNAKAIDLSELGNRKIIGIHEQPGLTKNSYGRSLYVVNLDSNEEYIIDIHDDILHLVTKFNLPEDYSIEYNLYLNNSTMYDYINCIGIWLLRRKGTHTFNVCTIQSEFKPLLDKDAGFLNNISHSTIKPANCIIVFDNDNERVIYKLNKDLTKAECLAKTPLAIQPIKCSDNSLIIINKVELAEGYQEATKSEDTIHKYDLTVCTKYKIFTLNNIYASEKMIKNWFAAVYSCNTGRFIEAPDNVLANNSGAIGIYFKNLETLEYDIFDTFGNVIYTDTKKGFNRHINANVQVNWSRYDPTSARIDFYGEYKIIPLEEFSFNNKNESILLKYASFLC